jgi:hypothetical protein
MRRLGLGIVVATLGLAPPAQASDLVVNRALGADSSAPALTDGDGSTTWCPTGPATIDLGRVPG